MNILLTLVFSLVTFTMHGAPGEPLLPIRIYHVALPPDADLSTVTLEVVGGEIVNTGPYTPELAVPDETAGNVVVDQKAIRAEDFVTLLSGGQMRQWKFVKILFSPYSLVGGERYVARSLDVRLTFDTGSTTSATMDGVLDDVAAELFVNYDEARQWYPGVSAQAYSYVIVTTNEIVVNSTKLAEFAAYRGATIITEDDYGSDIRGWLQANYIPQSIRYVLLIGDPVGDVPMLVAYPINHTEVQAAPTDYYYAELTGDWDYDNDGVFGEWGDDYGPNGGIELVPDVYVGRIPVYDSGESADPIFQKIMDFENEPAPAEWRQNCLLPMSFWSETYDNSILAEQMLSDYLGAGFRMYQQGSGSCGLNSLNPSEAELRGGHAVRDQWSSHPYGIVCWSGHGTETEARVGCDGCWDGTLFYSSYAQYLSDSRPAFVFQNSCWNAYPGNPSNLAFALLKHGAIGTVGATGLSWYNGGEGQGDFDDGSATNSSIAYEYVERVRGMPAGDALYLAKGGMVPLTNTRLMNLLVFNLYGDPAVSIDVMGPELPYKVFMPHVERGPDE